MCGVWASVVCYVLSPSYHHRIFHLETAPRVLHEATTSTPVTQHMLPASLSWPKLIRQQTRCPNRPLEKTVDPCIAWLGAIRPLIKMLDSESALMQ
ncbi:hypothetical protein HanPI659440_Chr17g0669641 [Helianthus annuus]|nr:hypothetical protein HanPI659440_Chr17g0669641 [Helianthus annuus]